MRRIHLKFIFAILWAVFALALVFDWIPDGISRTLVADELANVEPKLADKVRVCAWNLKNYGVSRRNVNGKWRDHPKPEFERAAIRKILAEINADVLLLCEIEDDAHLLELRSRLHSEGLSYKYWAIGSNPAPMKVAILSKIKPERFDDCSFVPFFFKGERRASPRGVVGAYFNSGGVRWRAYVSHLKSKYGAKKADKGFVDFRDAEVTNILKKIRSHKLPTLIAGDFNDEPPPLKSVFARFGYAMLEQRDPKGTSNTYFWAKKNFWGNYDRFYVNNSMLIYIPKNAKIYPSERASCSDHRPVYADFDFTRN